MFVQVMGGSPGRPRGWTPPAPFQVNEALTCRLIGSSQQCCERPGLRLRFTGGVTKAQRADVPGSGSDDPQVASRTPHPGLGPGHSPSARGHPESAYTWLPIEFHCWYSSVQQMCPEALCYSSDTA